VSDVYLKTRASTGRTDAIPAKLQTEYNLDVFVPSTATVTYQIECRIVGSDRWIPVATNADEDEILLLSKSFSGTATGGREWSVNIMTYSGTGSVEMRMALAKVYPS
jgi:hypothetical protein